MRMYPLYMKRQRQTYKLQKSIICGGIKNLYIWKVEGELYYKFNYRLLLKIDTNR